MDTSITLAELNSDQFDRDAPLWALVWLLFFEAEEENGTKIVRTYGELITMLASLTQLNPACVEDRLKHYREFDPVRPNPALFLGTAARRLRDFLVPLVQEIPPPFPATEN
jgi:hypothetical protein